MLIALKRLVEAWNTQSDLETYIYDVLSRENVEIVKVEFDAIDVSLSIILGSKPYPWEPGLESRQKIYDIGVHLIYWYFCDEKEDPIDWIRDLEPRKSFQGKYEFENGIGYVDSRFNRKKWENTYDFRQKVNKPGMKSGMITKKKQ